jgi:hypothetical protein
MHSGNQFHLDHLLYLHLTWMETINSYTLKSKNSHQDYTFAPAFHQHSLFATWDFLHERILFTHNLSHHMFNKIAGGKQIKTSPYSLRWTTEVAFYSKFLCPRVWRCSYGIYTAQLLCT